MAPGVKNGQMKAAERTYFMRRLTKLADLEAATKEKLTETMCFAYENGMTCKEIAYFTGISERAVRRTRDRDWAPPKKSRKAV